MSLFKLKAAPILLIEDNAQSNILPLLLELNDYERNNLKIFCYEQPVFLWKHHFRHANVQCYDEFHSTLFSVYTQDKCTVIIESINQMAIWLGWNDCLKCIIKLSKHPNIVKILLILHEDCLSHGSKLKSHLSHISNALVIYDAKNPVKVSIHIKKSGKIVKTEEMLTYDNKTNVLRLMPILKPVATETEPEKPAPGNLSTFKIEMEESEKLERNKLKLPYMSKINEGESKVYYEPDAVDDWDEEDPDEDLDL